MLCYVILNVSVDVSVLLEVIYTLLVDTIWFLKMVYHSYVPMSVCMKY